MLILSASDKDGAQPVTGKFGLGFKSVLLATDSPRILSADLHPVIGGCLPERWTGPEVEHAMGHERNRRTDGPRLRPTLIELHIEDSAKRRRSSRASRHSLGCRRFSATKRFGASRFKLRNANGGRRC